MQFLVPFPAARFASLTASYRTVACGWLEVDADQLALVLGRMNVLRCLLLWRLGLGVLAERAPDVAPVIDRPNWCVHGSPTRTTGECMCKWSNKEACVGPACHYEYGLSWHHYTCLECACQPKPWAAQGNQLRSHMVGGTPASRDGGGSTPPRPPQIPSLADEIAKLGALRVQGLLTEDEFRAGKAKLLLAGDSVRTV